MELPEWINEEGAELRLVGKQSEATWYVVNRMLNGGVEDRDYQKPSNLCSP